MKDLDKYLKKRSKNIETLLSTPRLKCTPEKLHDLRVEIKKLRSLFSLLKSSVDYDQKKMEKPFRKVFKQAGAVREIQVEEDMLQQYFSVDFLSDYRKKIKERKLKELRKYIVTVNSQYAKIKKRFSVTKDWISLVSKKMVIEFVDKRKKRMMNLLASDRITPPQLHLLRKRIKQYEYATKFRDGKSKKDLDVDSFSLTDFLGKWHDGQMLINRLERQLHNEIREDELDQIRKVKNEQIIVNNLTFNQIRGIISRITDNQKKL